MENSFKTYPEDQEQEKAERKSAKEKGFKSFFTVDKYIRYAAFLTFIGLVYIWNSHRAEKQVRREQDLKEAIEEAKADYRTIHARLSDESRKSTVASRVDTIGLKPLKEPPFKLARVK